MGEKEPIKIAAMKKGDLDQVLAIERSSFSAPWSRQLFLREILNPSISNLLVAYADRDSPLQKPDKRNVFGYIIFWVLVDEVHILNLATASAFRRQGVAKRLVLAALKRAFQKGARNAFLEVRASNTAAQKLYSDIGFTGIAARKAYYDTPTEDAVIMRLEKGAYTTLVDTVQDEISS